MKLALFLHLYQPSTQYPEILRRVVLESYEPLINILELNPKSVINLNVSGALIEQLAPNHEDLLSRIKVLRNRGQVELLGSACYHPLLTYLPDAEIKRQVRLNEQVIKNNLGGNITEGSGFFAPEMSINSRVCQVIRGLGYSYVLADESAVVTDNNQYLNQSRIFIDKGSGLRVVCRHKVLSLDIAFSKVRSFHELSALAKDLPYVFLAMDGETFGHHRPEQMELLQSIIHYVSANELQLAKISNLITVEPAMEIEVAASSWGESLKRWDNPENKLHVAQWRLFNLAIKAVNECQERDDNFWTERGLLDKGLQSDQFWWSSYNPCWHYKMVEKGAKLLLDAVQALPGDLPVKKEAQDLYDEITQTGLKMYGDTVIGC